MFLPQGLLADRGGIALAAQYNSRITDRYPRDRIFACHRVMGLCERLET